MLKRYTKRVLAFLVALIMMFSAVPAVYAAEESAQTQRFMSFNLRHDLTSHPLMGTGVRGEHLMELVKKYDPDSIGFQEGTNDWMNYLREAMGALGYDYAGVGRDDGKDGPEYTGDANEHTPVFYKTDKYELVEEDTFWLSETPDVLSGRDWGEACRRICTYVVLKDRETGEYYAHFNTHLDHVALDTQTNAVRVILNRIASVSEKYPELACVATGDFNSARASDTDSAYVPATYNYMTSRMDDAWAAAETVIKGGSSWSGYQNPAEWERDNPSMGDRPDIDTDNYPIDFIYLTKGAFDVKTYAIVDDTFTFDYNGTTWHDHPVSDHYGVFCEAERKEFPDEPTVDESKIIDYPAKTIMSSGEISKEALIALIGLSGNENLASGASVASSAKCTSDHPASGVLDTENTAQVSSSTGNIYWELTVDLGAVKETGAVAYTVGAEEENIPSNVEFFASTDNSGKWKKMGGTVLGKTAADSTTYMALEEPVSARYIKMVMADTPDKTEVKNISVYSAKKGEGETGPSSEIVKVDPSGVTAVSGPAPVNDNGEGYENLFDGNSGTKWYYKNLDGVLPAAIVFKTAAGTKACRYSFTTANDSARYTGRSPSKWVLSGAASADGPWTVLDDRTYQVPDVNSQEFTFDIENPAEYQFYRLQYHALGTEMRLQIADVSLYEEIIRDFADYSEVDAAITKIPENLEMYTKESLRTLADALAAVDRTKPAAEQESVDAMAKAVLAAVDGLEEEGLPYTDVDKESGGWYYDAVKMLYWSEIMTGIDKTTFGPAQPLKRAHFAMTLYRIAGCPEVVYENTFPDVHEGDWYADAVIWANRNGIITGYGDSGLFGPADDINREQMAAMMWRMAKKEGMDMTVTMDLEAFPDHELVHDFAEEAFAWCAENGIITGMGDGSLNPYGPAVRAQCAVVTARYMAVNEQ